MKKVVVILTVAVLAGFALYRYGGLDAGACDKAGPQKFECSTEESSIKDEETRCKAACPSQAEWAAYCNDKERRCKEDCELLLYEGKTQAEVDACKQACTEQKAKDLAAYKDKAACEAECAAAAEARLKALEAQYQKK